MFFFNLIELLDGLIPLFHCPISNVSQVMVTELMSHFSLIQTNTEIVCWLNA